MIENLLTALSERSTNAVISQSGFASEALRRYLRELLAKPAGQSDSFLADPVFEAAFGWKAAAETMAGLEGNLLHPSLVAALDDPKPVEPLERDEKYRFGRDWYPHRHQLEAWRALERQPAQSVLVTSGTGSGKTECFLVPVLNDLARQCQMRGRLSGVQALFLYPLNALINSQRDRLTDWTHAFGGDIRYCLYNGNTPEEIPESQQRQRPSQVLSRKTLRKDPPPILVTNITMLEYMLVRTIDAPIVDKSQGQLKWIILDEAHSYIGSQAAEVALLLRRVIQAFGVSSDQVRFIATSATIGDEAGTDAKLQQFLADLAGVSLERVTLVKGERAVPILPPGTVTSNVPDPVQLATLSPAEIYEKLANSEPMRRLRSTLAPQPMTLTKVGATLATPGQQRLDRPRILSLLEHAARAERCGERFLPLRIHLFHRSQPGLWGCINAECAGKAETALAAPEWPFGRVIPHAAETCPSCLSPTYELAACADCGVPVMLVEETDDGTLRTVRSDAAIDEFAQDIEPQPGEGGDGEDTDDDHGKSATKRLITSPGLAGTLAVWVEPKTRKVLDRADPSAIRIALSDSSSACLSCGSVDHNRLGPLFKSARFGAPFLLGNAIPQLLEFVPPRSETSETPLPDAGRQILTFTDSRQGTARFAAKLQQDSERNFIRSAIYHVVQSAWLKSPAAEKITRLEAELKQLEAGLAIESIRHLYDDKLIELRQLRHQLPTVPWRDLQRDLAGQTDLNVWMRDLWEDRDSSFTRPERLAELFLYREFLRRPKLYNSAETMGLAGLRFDVIDKIDGSRIPQAFRSRGSDLADWKNFLYFLITHFVRSNSAVAIDQGLLRWIGVSVPPRRIKPPRTEAARKAYELPWPQLNRGGRVGRVFQVLAYGLKLDIDSAEDRDVINEVLESAWLLISQLDARKSPDFQLDLTMANLVPLERVWLCPITHTALDQTIFGTSPYFPLVRGVTGGACAEVALPKFPFPWRRSGARTVGLEDIRDWLSQDPVVRAAREKEIWNNLHDRIATVAPYIRSAEHSAQQAAGRLQKYENEFKQGKINILCCSTTMEMGVDIGGISTVVMTNVPPAPSNYRQRVGRAGRRGEALSFGFTFCKDDPLGWTVFRKPTWPFDTSINAPAVSLDSPVIVQRHVNALLLGAFMKDLEHRTKDILKLQAGWFLAPTDPARGETLGPCDSFIAWCERPQGLPEIVGRNLEKLLKDTCLEQHSDIRFEASASLTNIAQAWRLERQSLLDDIAALVSDDRAAGTALKLQLQRLEENYLLTELITRGYLPGHGFPTDVVSFVNTTVHDTKPPSSSVYENPARSRDYPSRQLELAIRDYAPGTDVVVDGLVYRSKGITLNWKRPASDDAPPEIQALGYAWKCTDCGTTDQTTTLPEVCSACGGKVESLTFLRPAGFTVDVRDAPHTDITQVSYVAPTTPWISARGGQWASLPSAEVGRYRATPTGHVFHYTRGEHGLGYSLCLQCGRAAAELENAPGKPPKEILGHKPLRGGQRTAQGICPGATTSFSIRRNLSLGHNIRTDVLELQLTALDDRTTATSVAVASREALARIMGIENSELGWAVVRTRNHQREDCYSIFLYDQASGGAGFSVAGGNFVPEILRGARDILDCKNPDCVSHCPSCLLLNDTRFDEAQLDRHAALNFLRANVLDHLTLDASHAFFGQSSVAETRTLTEALDRVLTTSPSAAPFLWVGGEPSSWDFVGWPGISLLEKFAHKGRIGNIFLKSDTFRVLTFEQKLALHGLLERTRAQAFQIERFPGAAKGHVLAAVRDGERITAWACSTPLAQKADADWGYREGQIVVRGQLQNLDTADARPIRLSELFSSDTKRGNMLHIGTEANGGIEGFGNRFWEFVVTHKPEIGQLIRTGHPASVTYQDRYLFSPLVLRLLREVLRPLAAGSSERPKLAVRTLGARSGQAMSAPVLISHDWETLSHRDEILRTIFAQIGFAVDLDVASFEGLPHDRTLKVEWVNGGSVTLYLDQGFGYWRTQGRIPFNFTNASASQIEQLTRVSFPVTNRDSHKMAIFIPDVRL